MGDLESLLPDEFVIQPIVSGKELILTYDGAQRAVEIATRHSIAVLGVEMVRILGESLGVETYSGYDFKLEVWPDYVELNNREASQFLGTNERHEYRYILTSVSEREYSELDEFRARISVR